VFHITFNNVSYCCRQDESLLEMFLRYGVNVPFSCKNGVCQSCLLRSLNCRPSKTCQKGLTKKLIEKNYFLPCKCNPQQDMHLALPRPADNLISATIIDKQLLESDVLRLLIEPDSQFTYHAGQFINLHGPASIIRSYSLASVPGLENNLELQIKRVDHGRMTSWLFDKLDVGDEIKFHGPLGEAFFKPQHESQNLLLISTGSGIAPHIGIVKDAVYGKKHKGNIFLYHGSSDDTGHYLRHELRQLSTAHSNFHYHLCAERLSNSTPEVIRGSSLDIALEQQAEIADWIIFLSGNPDMVKTAQIRLHTLGIDENQIYADPFDYTFSEAQNTAHTTNLSTTTNKERRKFPAPDPEMWAALDNGKLMSKILTSFYQRVFEDELLSPYFSGVTQQRLIEKVYNFHYQMFTGKKVYFGERPRNAHHWMVIPPEIFNNYGSFTNSGRIASRGIQQVWGDRFTNPGCREIPCRRCTGRSSLTNF